MYAGGSFVIQGSDFTGGSEVNFFVATARGPINAGPLIPTAHTPTQLSVNIPATAPLGQGFVAVQVVNTDMDFVASNAASALLQGSAAAGIPSLTSINGKGLAATSSDPDFAANNVEAVVPQGTIVKLGGSGFDTTNGVAVDVFCDCPRGKVGAFPIIPGSAGFSSSSLTFALPATGINAPVTGPGSFVVSNRGSDGLYLKKSNAVSAPIGQQISVTLVSRTGNTITVNGSGFCTLTVINLFNPQASGVVNLGGLDKSGAAKIPIKVISSNQLTFLRPAGAQAGPSYVHALNAPFVPYTSSGNDPGGAFDLR